MQHKNSLKEILTKGLQIESLKPSEDLLLNMGNSSLKRWTNIINNEGKELQAFEKQAIENWLLLITGIEINIMKDGAEKITHQTTRQHA